MTRSAVLLSFALPALAYAQGAETAASAPFPWKDVAFTAFGVATFVFWRLWDTQRVAHKDALKSQKDAHDAAKQAQADAHKADIAFLQQRVAALESRLTAQEVGLASVKETGGPIMAVVLRQFGEFQSRLETMGKAVSETRENVAKLLGAREAST